jgi:hypothetical protein
MLATNSEAAVFRGALSQKSDRERLRHLAVEIHNNCPQMPTSSHIKTNFLGQ